MTSTVAQGTATAPLTTRNRVGVVLAVLLALLDVGGLAQLAATPAPGEQGPPDAVLVLGAVLGVITLAAAVVTWARHSRAGLRVIAATRLLSALLALPAFLVEGVPDPIVVFTAVALVVTLGTVALLVSRR